MMIQRLCACGALMILTAGTTDVEAFTPTSIRSLQKHRQSLVLRYLETKEKANEKRKSSNSIFPLMKGSGQGRAPNGVDSESTMDDTENAESAKPLIPDNSLVALTAFIGAVAVASHAGDYASFFQSLATMKANIANPADFWPSVNFWVFFAVSHAILQPIFWISEVLHASPGPKIADLVPVSFLFGNVVAIGAVTFSKEVSELCGLLSVLCSQIAIVLELLTKELDFSC
jgi:hypothetical protein